MVLRNTVFPNIRFPQATHLGHGQLLVRKTTFLAQTATAFLLSLATKPWERLQHLPIPWQGDQRLEVFMKIYRRFVINICVLIQANQKILKLQPGMVLKIVKNGLTLGKKTLKNERWNYRTFRSKILDLHQRWKKCNTKIYMVLNYVNIQKYEKGSVSRWKLAQSGVNSRNVNMIVSCVRVPEGVPHFKEELAG